MIPKGVLQHAEIPRVINDWNMPTSKFGNFWRQTQDKKKIDFWTEDKYSFKSFQSNQCVRKRPLRQFLGLPRDEEKAHKRWSQGER